ncbi:TetR/AcrR family transcriptional regulator C-terminal domain-containing protein [Dactylosporangium sp. NPDC051484]|uniref:TetR/AcrR family transcriptional regulator C-terminal domain-containing protein n=1 Tax=Dactylosporangium sp. NPDC051484 TaxID=3154942 RepID=UPI00344F7641
MPDAARGVAALLHYTVGHTIEEQARHGTEYGEQSPYRPQRLTETFDPARHPLAARVATEVLFGPDPDFEHGLALLLTGMTARLTTTSTRAREG